jgi:hypothetical protein
MIITTTKDVVVVEGAEEEVVDEVVDEDEAPDEAPDRPRKTAKRKTRSNQMPQPLQTLSKNKWEHSQ